MQDVPVMVFSPLSAPVVAEGLSAPGYGVTSFSLAYVVRVVLLVVVARERFFECLVRVAAAPVRLCALLDASDVIDMMYVMRASQKQKR